jgi:hypothetical protein
MIEMHYWAVIFTVFYCKRKLLFCSCLETKLRPPLVCRSGAPTEKAATLGSSFHYHGRCFCTKRRPLGRHSSTLSSGQGAAASAVNDDPWFQHTKQRPLGRCFCGKRRPLGRRSSIPSSGRKAAASAVNGDLWVAVPVVSISSDLLAAASPVHGGPQGLPRSSERRPLLAAA